MTDIKKKREGAKKLLSGARGNTTYVRSGGGEVGRRALMHSHHAFRNI